MIDKYVRLAQLSDIPTLVKFSKHFHEASPYRSLAFDRNKCEAFVREGIESPSYRQIVFVGIKENEPIGFLAATASEPIFSTTKIAMELGWWVEPEFRSSRASFLLYKVYEDWALRAGCEFVQGAFLPGVSNDLDDFYKKQGYIQVESSYMKRINFNGSV